MIGLLPHMGVHQFKITQRGNAYQFFALVLTLNPLTIPFHQHLLLFFRTVYGVQGKVVLRSFAVVCPRKLQGFPVLGSFHDLFNLFHVGIIGRFQSSL